MYFIFCFTHFLISLFHFNGCFIIWHDTDIPQKFKPSERRALLFDGRKKSLFVSVFKDVKLMLF